MGSEHGCEAFFKDGRRGPVEVQGCFPGTYVSVNGAAPIGIGTFGGIGVYLSGTDLPDQVYTKNDVNEPIGRCAWRGRLVLCAS
jgi:hypothetical protein